MVVDTCSHDLENAQTSVEDTTETDDEIFMEVCHNPWQRKKRLGLGQYKIAESANNCKKSPAILYLFWSFISCVTLRDSVFLSIFWFVCHIFRAGIFSETKSLSSALFISEGSGAT